MVTAINQKHPWPDDPRIPDMQDKPWDEMDAIDDYYEPPTEEDIEEQNILMLRQQCIFRWAAQLIAIEASALFEVKRIAAFGSVSLPLLAEVPRFKQFRRHRVPVLHECADLDMAFWLTSFDNLNTLRKTLSRALSFVQETQFGGVAHHQVDTHLFDDTHYRGRLCKFGQCPKPQKRECYVPGCGQKPFLRQFDDYRFNDARFNVEPKVVLFDRESEFLVSRPRIAR